MNNKLLGSRYTITTRTDLNQRNEFQCCGSEPRTLRLSFCIGTSFLFYGRRSHAGTKLNIQLCRTKNPRNACISLIYHHLLWQKIHQLYLEQLWTVGFDYLSFLSCSVATHRYQHSCDFSTTKYTECQAFFPVLRIGSPQPPHMPASVAPPSCVQGGRHARLRGREWGVEHWKDTQVLQSPGTV
jgi:hypothetical protein